MARIPRSLSGGAARQKEKIQESQKLRGECAVPNSCPVCGAEFPYKVELAVHLEEKHKGGQAPKKAPPASWKPLALAAALAALFACSAVVQQGMKHLPDLNLRIRSQAPSR